MCIKKSFALSVLAGLEMVLPCQELAQTFSRLYSFSETSTPSFTNQDGANPYGRLTVLGNTLFGAAQYGGNTGNGVVFKLNTDGTAFTVLHSFTSLHTNSSGVAYNSDGANPMGTLVVSGDSLYGTTCGGGVSGNGTVFAIKTDGSGFQILHSFSDYAPNGDLALSGNSLYGLSGYWSSGGGTLFKISIDGGSFSTLLVFDQNSQYEPVGGLSLWGDALYGALNQARYETGSGMTFRINTDGTNLNTIYSFSGLINFTNVRTNADGASPNGNLVISGSTVFGTTWGGGILGYGTVFALNLDGTAFRILHNFTGGEDGFYPPQGLILSNGLLYGVAAADTVWGVPIGFIAFSMNANGTGFRTLHYERSFSNGSSPGGLVLSGTTLYGMSAYGAASGNGMIFSITLQPSLTLTTSGQNLLLSWPTNFTGFALQQSVDISPTGWTTYTLQSPLTISNGQFVVTIPHTATNTKQFFRLSQ